MTRALQFLVAVLACAGCAREVTMFEGAPTDDARAVLLVALHTDTVEVHAIDLTQNEAGAVLANATDVELFAMSLKRELAYHRLEAGPLPVAPDGARDWPRSQSLHHSAVAGGVQSGWTSIETLPARITDLSLDLEPLSACDVGPVGFDVVNHELPTKEDGWWAARYDERTALVMAGGDAFLVTPEEVTPVALVGEPAGGMYQAPDGSIWIIEWRGVWRAPLGSLEFQRVANGPARASFVSVAGPTDPSAPFEIFALNVQGHVDHFDGTSWTQHGESIPGDHGAVLWVSPGRVAVVREANSYVEWIDGGEITNEVVFEGFNQGLVELNAFEPYQLVAGTRDGYVIVRRDDTWEDLGPALLDFAFEVEQDSETYVVAGSGGEVARWIEGFGFCTERLAPSHVHQLLPLAGGYVVLMSNLDSWSTDVVEDRRFATPISWFFPR